MTDRAYFNVKQTKRSNPEARTTLDNLHTLQITELRREKDEVDKVKEQIQELEKKIEDTADIIIRTQLEDKLEEFYDKKRKLETNEDIYSYFFETGDILYKYYEIQDNIQKGQVKGGRQLKVMPGSVLAALQEGNDEQEVLSEVLKKKDSGIPDEGREVLLEKYLQKIDPEHARTITNVMEEPYGICDYCDKEMVFSANEALFYCDKCGNQEFILIDSDKPSYKDPPREVTYYAYKRINHFNEWLAQFQAKESTEIPEELFQAIVEELKKERISNPEQIKQTKIREILKKLKCTNFYEHVPYILNRINGKTAPVMSREIEEKLRVMFKEIQSSFVKHRPKSRSNFLSYSYVLYKFCELLELDDYLQCFPLLKNRDKLYNQDKIWQLICKDLQWEFIRSI
jgi:hypothetical protein